MNVLLVTSWDIPCGIAESSAMLKEYVERADPEIELEPHPEALDPNHAILGSLGGVSVVHLNYHAALHSRWGLPEIRMMQERGLKVVVTFHDTMSGAADQPNSDKCKALCHAADAFIVHEPVADLPGAIYWRQGVPAAAEWPITHGLQNEQLREYRHRCNSSFFQPIVGSCGFPFPWKNYDLLAEASAAAGWALLLIAPNATDEQVAGWQQRNPNSRIHTEFLPRTAVVQMLTGCDATAFLYLCANTGTSGAIRMGMAARKPLLATHPDACRQFRDLADREEDTEPFMPSMTSLRTGITWLKDLSPFGVTGALAAVTPHYRLHRTAQWDSWTQLGKKYAKLYRSLV